MLQPRKDCVRLTSARQNLIARAGFITDCSAPKRGAANHYEFGADRQSFHDVTTATAAAVDDYSCFVPDLIRLLSVANSVRVLVRCTTQSAII